MRQGVVGLIQFPVRAHIAGNPLMFLSLALFFLESIEIYPQVRIFFKDDPLYLMSISFLLPLPLPYIAAENIHIHVAMCGYVLV